jgi:6-phosphogluconolactonase
MTMAELHSYPDAASLTADLARTVVGRLTKAVAAKGKASLVCAGGTTPGELYEAMSALQAPWNKIMVTASDERWAPPDSEASNERLVRATLLKGHAAAAMYVPLRTEDATPEAAEGAVGAAVAAMPRPFTVTLIGMGTDLHIASLCPEAGGLAAAMNASDPALARAIRAKSGAGSNIRMTLTIRALLDSDVVILLIRGDAKLKAYQEALAGDDVLAGPVRAVLQQAKTPVHVYWSP